ncbi:hypothetical protein K438DRAFT_2023665 [Mycena galopus ATCC 62051]|nr:hypothetical protein K438DRAFT_2023665 [Mycena galopus ATCC 62051]
MTFSFTSFSADLPFKNADSEPEPDTHKGRSFLPAFSHKQRDSPPAYEEVVAPKPGEFSSFKDTTFTYLKTLKGQKPNRQTALENELEILKKYDTVILVDDSFSMNWPGSKRGLSRWDEARKALEPLAEVAGKYDQDGIDIHFLNDPRSGLGLKTSEDVRTVFNRVTPDGPTPTGDRLEQLLKPHLEILEEATIQRDGTPIDKETGKAIKRINFIVITDGESSDDVKGPVIDAATRLTALRNLNSVQLGIQFFQIGKDARATKALKELDDDISKAENIRDIVDTTPYKKLNPITSKGLLKVLAGGINRRVDAQQ